MKMKKVTLMVAVLFLFSGIIYMNSGATVFASADAGKALFNGAGKCKNCHKTTDKKKVGPGLAGITKRATDGWIRSWLKDPKAVWTANDPYTAGLKKIMKKEGKPKPSHKTKALSDQEINDLMDYLKTM